MITPKTIKRASLQVSKNLGAYNLLLNSEWRRKRLLILCYHGIALEDEHEWQPAMYMNVAAFEARLKILKSGGYCVLPLAEALQRMYAGDLPERSVAITFDDGAYDFYKQAHPLLKAYNFPVTVYITTYYCDYNKPVFGMICSYMMWQKRGTTVDGRKIIGADFTMNLANENGRDAALKVIADFVEKENLSAPEKDGVARRLASCLGVDYDQLLAKRVLHIMNREEVETLADQGVDFQLHTHRHRTPLDSKLFHREIADNRRYIQDMTGACADHFCYPSGTYKPEFLPWLNEDKVVSATTCDPDIASAQSHALMLPRLVDHSRLAPIEFEGWLTGISSFLPRQRSYADAAD